MNTPTLSDILSKKLEQKRKEHPSFRLMDIDDRLFPNAQTMNSTLVLEARDSNNELKTVREIVAESWEKGSQNHLMIEGEGGIGKTVTLLSIPDKFTLFPVPAIYIPLHELTKKEDPIEHYVKRWILNNKEDLYEQLLNLLDEPWDNGPQLMLLLDGFNEIAAENRQIISEDICHWSEYPGIQIVTSSRYDIHTYVALSYDYSTIKLQPLSDRTVEGYLKSAGVPIPANSVVKQLITIPLLLKLYEKTALILEQRETDSSNFREVKNAGSIVWNYLQCELWRFGREAENAKTAIIAMEFIAPYIAWQMQQKALFVLNKREFHDFLEEAYRLLEKHFDKADDFPFHISDAIQKANGLPQLDFIRNLLENILCLFVKNGNDYRLMHQQFRDALAAMHLINLSYLSGDSLPQEWNTPIDHYVMQFVVDLISDTEAYRLWEQNRNSIPTIENATRNQLRLQGLFHNNDFTHLDFSGLDLNNISLYPYNTNNTTIKLPDKSERMDKTKFSEITFSPEGHTNGVYTLAVTPDGKRLISGSYDYTIRIWDVETSAPMAKPLLGHDGWVNSIAVTPDGKCLISGSEDKTIRIWDLETHNQIGNAIQGHEKSVNAIAITTDGKRIVSGSDDKTIRIWDLETHSQIGNPIQGHEKPVNAIAITTDGKRIISGSDDKTIRIWNMETCMQIGKAIKGHEDCVNAVAINKNGNRIISGSDDRTIRIWNIDTGEQIGKSIQGYNYSVRALTITPDDKRIVSGLGDKTIRIWDLETRLPIENPFRGHEDWIRAVTVTPDGKYIISGSGDRTIRIWDLETGEQIRRPLMGHDGPVNSVAVTPDGKRIVSSAQDKTIRIWNIDTGEQIGHPITGHNDSVQAIVVTPDGKRIVSGSDDKTIRIWNLETGKQIGKPFEGHGNWVRTVAVTSDGTRIVSGSDDKTIRIWDMETHNQLGNPFIGHENMIRTVAVTRNCKYVISGSGDKTVRVWELKTGKQIGEPIEEHDSWVRVVAVTSDNKYVVSGSWYGTICITNIETRESRTIRIHPLSFVGLDFSKALFSTPELKETLRQNGAKV